MSAPAPDAQRLLQERLAAAPIPRNAQYSMALGKASDDIAPSMVFDDGRFTYLRFAGNRPLPAIFQTGPDGSEETVNVRMGEDDLLVADRVARRLVLRLGQAVVVVVNDAFDLEGQPAVEGTTVPGVARALTQALTQTPQSMIQPSRPARQATPQVPTKMLPVSQPVRAPVPDLKTAANLSASVSATTPVPAMATPAAIVPAASSQQATTSTRPGATAPALAPADDAPAQPRDAL